MIKAKRPSESEYNPYFKHYIGLVVENDYNEAFSNAQKEIELLQSLIGGKGLYSYAEGKWSINEIIAHIIDCERVFAYRALSFSRGVKQLPSFDHDEFAKYSNANQRTTEDLVSELVGLRNSTCQLLKSFTENQFACSGKIDENAISVNAIAYIIVGHQRHHFNVIKERYL